MRHTPLYEAHVRLGAKMVDFGGWAMPVSYPTGILEEHRATRTAVGVFDVCHMGEVHFTGPGAAATVQRLVTNDVARLEDGRAFYTVACLPSGGIVDDLIVYRLRPDHYVAVVNASNVDKDVDWFQEHRGADCKIEDASARTGLIAFQGPAAQQALQSLASIPLDRLRPFSLGDRRHRGGAVRLDRPHRLHRRGRLRAVLRRAGRPGAVGPPADAPAASRSAWARATRCASRRGCRSTATTSTTRPRRSRRASAGS